MRRDWKAKGCGAICDQQISVEMSRATHGPLALRLWQQRISVPPRKLSWQSKRGEGGSVGKECV